MKSPALNNAGLQKVCRFFGFVVSNCPSCLAVCFTWPQVALTHHVFQFWFIRRCCWRCQALGAPAKRTGEALDHLGQRLPATANLLLDTTNRIWLNCSQSPSDLSIS